MPLGHAAVDMAAEASQYKDSAVDGTAQASGALIKKFGPFLVTHACKKYTTTTSPAAPDVATGTISESQTGDSPPSRTAKSNATETECDAGHKVEPSPTILCWWEYAEWNSSHSVVPKCTHTVLHRRNANDRTHSFMACRVHEDSRARKRPQSILYTTPPRGITLVGDCPHALRTW